MSDDELKALAEEAISEHWRGDNATKRLHKLAQAVLERLGAQGKLTDADCDEIARYVGVPALKLRNAVAVISRLTTPSKAGEPQGVLDRMFELCRDGRVASECVSTTHAVGWNACITWMESALCAVRASPPVQGAEETK